MLSASPINWITPELCSGSQPKCQPFIGEGRSHRSSCDQHVKNSYPNDRCPTAVVTAFPDLSWVKVCSTWRASVLSIRLPSGSRPCPRLEQIHSPMLGIITIAVPVPGGDTSKDAFTDRMEYSLRIVRLTAACAEGAVQADPDRLAFAGQR